MGLSEARDLRSLLAEALAAPGAGLLLDLDGTLVLSEPMHRTAYRRYFRSRGWTVPDDVLGAFTGRRAAEVFAALDGPWHGEDPDALTSGVLEVLAAMVAAGARPEEVPGAVRVLAGATRAGLPTAVVTSARRVWTVRVLEALGAPEGLALVTGEDCTHGKPDPEPYRRGAEALGLPPAGLLAVEDAPAGVASARAAGVGVVLGVTTTLPAAALREAGAHACTDDLRTLAAAVEDLRPQPPTHGAHRPL